MGKQRFAHPAEAEYAALLDAHGIPWQYEPHTFPLAVDARGNVTEAATPDFYLPTVGAYVECTTMKPGLASRKRRKFRKLRETYGVVVNLLERHDLQRLFAR